MLVIPVIHKSARKQIPYVTLALVIINILVYFLFQANDNRLSYEAMEYYEKSGLEKIELEAYREYLEKNKPDQVERQLSEERLFYKMMDDDQFLSLLENNRIITSEQDGFEKWRGKHDRFRAKKEKIVGYRFGYRPVDRNVPGLFSSMFLHSSVGHLVGNMIFLYLVGTLLELGVGRPLFLVGYLVTGVCATWLFGFAYPLSQGPLVGASGAVSGLMGGYAVLFWVRKIAIFFSLGFYFNYARVPAIILLPFWIGKEILQLYFNEGSNVAYMAHIGGLVSGSLLAAGHKILKRDGVDELFREEEEEDKVTVRLEKGLAKMARLEMDGARREIEAVLAIQPDHRQALRLLFQINKADPGSDRFHKSGLALLDSMTKEEDLQFVELVEEYSEAAGQPRLTRSIILRLTGIYLKKKEYSRAEACLARLLKEKGEAANIPHMLMCLARGYKEKGDMGRTKNCLSVLARRFPASEEGEKAALVLNKSKG